MTTLRRARPLALAGCLLAACGSGVTAGATATATASTAVAPAPGATPTSPSGGPVPAGLAGTWVHVDRANVVLTLAGDTYTWSDGTGGIVAVNGDEIDFYNAAAAACYAIGRYRWTISDGVLTTTGLGADPCPRGGVLSSSRWHRPP